MTKHGDFELYINAPVIYGMPKSLFDVDGVDAYFNAIGSAAHSLDTWVLIENPQCQAVFTPAAINKVLQRYAELADWGCQGIALQLSNSVARILKYQQQLNDLPIPFLASNNQIEIGKFLEQQMEAPALKSNLAG